MAKAKQQKEQPKKQPANKVPLCKVCNEPLKIVENASEYQCQVCGLIYPINNEWGNWDEVVNKNDKKD